MLTVDAREQMIEQQVRAWDVLDQHVLEIFRRVPREHFVPGAQRFLAFADVEVPLPEGQNMLRPSVVGRLLQALALQGKESVLEIGAGSGFVTACLAAMSARVTAWEVFPELAALARNNLNTLRVANAEVAAVDAITQIADGKRYDAIAATASMPVYDDRFARQLELGGRLFVVVGTAPVMEARLIRRTGENSWEVQSLFETVIDPLVNAIRPPGFTF
ncbi:MAG TPA: protein-L-isoaspartate O-methyltransferase [Steroidobacteraceae bacterium]|nr:protein-L-isoaspartate O-methyltransferase [Steroidobacteraceae bacterium]